MLFNLIERLTGLPFGFLPNGDNTVIAGKDHETGSRIAKELDKVTFVELRKNTALYMEVDADKDVVVAIGPWRQLAFINNDAGSGVDETLRKMEHSEISNLILVSAPGDFLFKNIMKACEEDEKKGKAAEPEFETEPRKRKRQPRGSDSDFRPTAERLSESDDKRPPESTTTATVASTERLFDPEKLIDFFGGNEKKEKAAEPEPRKRKRQPRGSDSDFRPTAERLSEPTAIVIPPGSFDDTEEPMRQSNSNPAPESAVILDVEEDDD